MITLQQENVAFPSTSGFLRDSSGCISSSVMSTHKQHKIWNPVLGYYRQSLNKPFKNNHTPFPKHHIQQLPACLKYLQYPQKPGKCLPHFPFDCPTIRGQVLTYTRHERCLPFTLTLGNLQLTGAYHRRSTSYGIRYQQCDSSSTTAIHTFCSWAVPNFQIFTRPAAVIWYKSKRQDTFLAPPQLKKQRLRKCVSFLFVFHSIQTLDRVL